MHDREKVIKGLELCSNILGCIGNIDPECPYALRDGGCRHNDLLSDALALLKEQEPVKPNIVGASKSGRRWGYCGLCGAGLRIANGSRDAYCWRCGREVDWND